MGRRSPLFSPAPTEAEIAVQELEDEVEAMQDMARYARRTRRRLGLTRPSWRGAGAARAPGDNDNNVSTAVVRACGRGAGGTSRLACCTACGTSALRVRQDGSVSRCSMSPNPQLGQIWMPIDSRPRDVSGFSYKFCPFDSDVWV